MSQEPRALNIRVLVVEDERIIARDIEQTLRSFGITVCGSATSASEAVQKALATNPDLVLMDVRLQGGSDGIAAARDIESQRDVPVVFLTAHADEATLDRAAGTTPYGYVLKPFDERDLYVTLVMALCKHRAFARLEDEVRVRTAELEEAVRARDEFLSIAAHELRTPLTPLRLQLDSLELALERGGLLDDEALRRRLDRATSSTLRLSRLVDDLLDVSRLRIGHMRLAPQEVDLVAIARDAIANHSGEARRDTTPVRLLAPAPVVGWWDRARLEQVVGNLLVNALKYGAGKPVDVAVSGLDGTARLEVRDQGIGIEPADAERIFDRFERAVSAHHYGGLGLGLYIARQIVVAHGGEIGVESQPGAGATFRVELPRTPPTEPPRTRVEAPT